jgi:acetyltransferase-like isoleucine patch superfamily enzyme
VSDDVEGIADAAPVRETPLPVRPGFRSNVPLELRELSPARLRLLQLLSALVIRWYRMRRGSRVRFGRGVVAGRLDIRGPGLVEVEDGANLYSFVGWTRLYTRAAGARIHIGPNVRLNGTTVQAAASVEIGEDSILGDANIMDTDMHALAPDRRHDPDAPVRVEPVVIEPNVWIGGQAAVLPGVRIGRNTVVGFRAVVTSDVPADVVVAGNPARVVRQVEG